MSRLPAPENNPVNAPEALSQADSKSSSIDVEEARRINQPELRNRSKGISFVSSITKNEPVVTRRELWSYYRALHGHFVMESADIFSVYYNGDNVYLS